MILGHPGAGKTTALANLTRQLLDEGQAEVPVIFNLSSWASEQPPLADWLVDELQRQYQVSRKLGQQWINEERLILLLDG